MEPSDVTPVTKQKRLIALLQQPNGATIGELTAATGWQKHSVRGTMTGVLKKRLGYEISSRIETRGRVYRIITDAE
jgi:hypothetical protein